MKPLHLFTPVRLDYILASARRTGLTADQSDCLLPLMAAKFWMWGVAAVFWPNHYADWGGTYSN